ncbi:MAG: PAS domain-containing sensor histidine kinase [Candidatus Bathyarchaeia archaeon]
MKIRTTLLLSSFGFLLWLMIGFSFTQITYQSFYDWLMFKVPSNELNLGILTWVIFAAATLMLAKNSLAADSKAEQLRKTNDNLNSLLDNLPVGVYRITPTGGILQSNRQFARILGYESLQQLRTINLNEVYVNKSDRQAYLERLREGPQFAEFEIRRKDGRSVWVREYPRAAMKVDGAIDYIDGVCVEAHGIDAIMRDITEHKKLESMKDNFIVTVTHELRTPLVSIKGYVDHIIQSESKLNPTIKPQLDVVRRNADRLLELTNDLLTIQSYESGKLDVTVEKLNLQEILAEYIEEAQPLFRSKEQVVKLDAPDKPLLVLGNRLRLGEVMMNLLDNASKFTPEKGHIIIRVEEGATEAVVYVSDSGIGIDKKDLEHVFDPFAAIKKPTYFKGSGLGLSLAKKLVEAQKGKIWAFSQGKGSGATFVFTLPKPREEAVRIFG